jgi:hypothetical protein
VVNMFNVMLQKKLRKDDDDTGTGEDSEAKEKKGKKNSNLVSAHCSMTLVMALLCNIKYFSLIQ